MRAAVWPALLLLLAAHAGARAVLRDHRALEAASDSGAAGASPAPAPPKCEAALCLPKKRGFFSSKLHTLIGRAAHYCGAPEPLANTACVAPAAAPGARATTMSAFCEGTAYVQLTSLTIGDVSNDIVYLPHEDPALAKKEQLWCKPTAAGAMPTAEYEKLARSDARPPWAADARRVSAKDAGSPAIADHYARVWNLRLQPGAHWPIEGTATIAAPADGCGRVGTGAGVVVEGLAARSSISCATVPGGQVEVKATMARVQAGGVYPISKVAFKFAERSAVPFDGRWAALALRVGATFAPGPALGAAAWAALADDVDAAIQASNGVPRALRPFVYSFLASDPALYASAAALAAAPGLATSASPRAYFDAKTPAEVLGWLRPCPNSWPPYSSPLYDKLQADIAQLAAATTKDEVERRKARTALMNKFAADHPTEMKEKKLFEDNFINPASTRPCLAFLQIWLDVRQTQRSAPPIMPFVLRCLRRPPCRPPPPLPCSRLSATTFSRRIRARCQRA